MFTKERCLLMEVSLCLFSLLFSEGKFQKVIVAIYPILLKFQVFLE